MDSYFSGVMRTLFMNDLESAGDTNPCGSSTPDGNDKICEALLDQDLTKIIMNAHYGIDFKRLMTTKKVLKISLDYFLSTSTYSIRCQMSTMGLLPCPV